MWDAKSAMGCPCNIWFHYNITLLRLPEYVIHAQFTYSHVHSVSLKDVNIANFDVQNTCVQTYIKKLKKIKYNDKLIFRMKFKIQLKGELLF